MLIHALLLPVAQSWSAQHGPAHYIERAAYAVLREGRAELVMGPHEYMSGAATMHLCYAGHEGLHYDADSSMGPDYLASLIESGQADVTADWGRCAGYLREYALQLGLPNH